MPSQSPSEPAHGRSRAIFLGWAWLVLAFATGAHAEVTEVRVVPSRTDPNIRTFDSPHVLYVNRAIAVSHEASLPADRHTLLLWLPGTHGVPGTANDFCRLAADQGYRVASLMYPDDLFAMTARFDHDPKALGNFRLAVLQGGSLRYFAAAQPHGSRSQADELADGRTRDMSVGKAESIENRCLQLLRFAQAQRPDEDWRQFLTPEGGIKWEAVAVCGHSEGGANAAFIGLKHRVARVICLGAPREYDMRRNAPAAWCGEPSATPKDRFFSFTHAQDAIGPTPAQMQNILKALGLAAYGPPVDVAKESPPYHHTRILLTSVPVFPALAPDGSVHTGAHGSVISDQYAARLQRAWTYLLTEKVSGQ